MLGLLTGSLATTPDLDSINVGSTQDMRGVLALLIIGAVIIITAIALVRGADPQTILNIFLPLGTLVLGFYFGSQSGRNQNGGS